MKRHRKTLSAYQKRNRILREMGYPSYAAYLASPLWSRIRERILSRDDHHCRVCDGPATEVHHQRYTALALKGEDLLALYSLCRRCHERIEFEGGRKSKMTSVRKRLALQLSARYTNKQRKGTDRQNGKSTPPSAEASRYSDKRVATQQDQGGKLPRP